MAGVKWIRLNTDMFDNAKIKYLRTLPEGNNIVLFWVMLLAKAGKCNSNGYIFLTENIPYSPEMLAAEFDFEVNTVNLALMSLSNLNMIQLEEHTLLIPSFDEHQNAEGLDKIREQTKKRVAKYREKQKRLESNVTSNVTVTQSNALDIERDKEEDKEIDIDKIIETWNSLNLNKLVSIKNKRLDSLKARVKEYGFNEIIQAIESIKQSSFLKGNNNRNWTITFDWFIKPNNCIKVIEGNYVDKENKNGFGNSNSRIESKEQGISGTTAPGWEGVDWSKF